MPNKHFHYCVLRTDTGHTISAGRSIVSACYAMNVGTVWGGGLTPKDAYAQAKQRLDALNEAMQRCPHPLDGLRVYREPIESR